MKKRLSDDECGCLIYQDTEVLLCFLSRLAHSSLLACPSVNGDVSIGRKDEKVSNVSFDMPHVSNGLRHKRKLGAGQVSSQPEDKLQVASELAKDALNSKQVLRLSQGLVNNRVSTDPLKRSLISPQIWPKQTQSNIRSRVRHGVGLPLCGAGQVERKSNSTQRAKCTSPICSSFALKHLSKQPRIDQKNGHNRATCCGGDGCRSRPLQYIPYMAVSFLNHDLRTHRNSSGWCELSDENNVGVSYELS